jgi:hypothetical protein
VTGMAKLADICQKLILNDRLHRWGSVIGFLLQH